jgi:hypothetical protein
MNMRTFYELPVQIIAVDKFEYFDFSLFDSEQYNKN